MLIRFVRQHHLAGRAYFDGQAYDVATDTALQLIGAGIAERVEQKALEEPPEDKQVSQSSMKRAGR